MYCSVFERTCSPLIRKCGTSSKRLQTIKPIIYIGVSVIRVKVVNLGYFRSISEISLIPLRGLSERGMYVYLN
jgi:hypothetical protein